MAREDLEYDGEKVDMELFQGFDVLEGEGCEGGECRKPESIIKEAFEEYSEGEDLSAILSSYEDIGIVVNDNNRPTPTHLVLEYLCEEHRDITDRIKRVHVATGTHSAPDESDLRKILGESYELLSDRIHIHDSRDAGSHLSYGETSRKTELRFDSALENHDLLILVNSVEPHYFAGYTGGRKSIIPGISAYETVERNHSHALDEMARGLKLAGNPVNEDMEEAAGIYLSGKNVISIQLVQGPGKLLVNAFVGDLEETFMQGVEVAKKEFCRPIKKLYDVVVTFAKPPLDRSLYQSQKAMENGKLALKDGGTLILVASCRDGIGPSAFWDLLTSGDDPDLLLEEIHSDYKLGYHKAAKIVMLSKRADIRVVTRIENETIKRGFMKGYDTIESALEKKINEADKKLLIPDGCVTVPILED